MKQKSIFILALISLLAIVPFVSAQSSFSQSVGNFVNGISGIIEPIAKLLVGDLTGAGSFDSSDVLWSKTLFLILIFSVIYLTFSKVDFFSSSPTVHFIMTLVVALLATRWIGDASAIQAILLPYSALGAALSAALPFVAAFILINVGLKNRASSIRRLAWIFFGIVFLFYWGSTASDIATSNVPDVFIWIYPLTAILAFIMAVMDGTYRRFWLKIELENLEKGSADEAIIFLKQKEAEIPDLISKGIITGNEATARRKMITKKLRDLSKFG